MQKKRKDNQFIKQAFYEGGNTAFRKFVSENLKYPQEALKNDIEGIVHLKIDIDHKGKVTGTKLMKGIGHGCDEEAKRIMKLAKYEVPANPKKLRVKFHKNVRIQFKKPKEKVQPKKVIKEKAQPTPNKSMSISYQITSTPKPQSTPAKKKSKSSYNYTINYNS